MSRRAARCAYPSDQPPATCGAVSGRDRAPERGPCRRRAGCRGRESAGCAERTARSSTNIPIRGPRRQSTDRAPSRRRQPITHGEHHAPAEGGEQPGRRRRPRRRRPRQAPRARPRRRGRGRRIRRRRRRDGRGGRARAALSPPVQDPGGHQAPAGHAGAGGQGRARHQGRGADDLSLARRPLLRADAQHRARRRHQPQDHQRRRPQEAPRDRRGARGSGGHGRDPAHRRRRPHQGRGQARLRISAADLGAGPRPDAEIDRADAGLRGRLARQALDPRSLHQGHRRDRRRRRERLQGRQGIHAHAHAEPCEEREALHRTRSRSSPATASRASSTRCSRRPCNCAPAATS